MHKSREYKGIVYIRISDLPIEQQRAIQNWLNDDVVIKIKTATALLNDCILYKNYEYWFEKIFTNAVPGALEERKSEIKAATKVGGLVLTNPKHL